MSLPAAIWDTLPGNGWLSRPEADLLWEAAGRVDGAILEVGSYHGRSTVLLAATGRPVLAIDPFTGFDSDDTSGELAYRAFRTNLRERGIENVTLLRQHVEKWRGRIPVGLAYLDGDHTYLGTASQVDAAFRCGARVIAIHDVNDQGEGIEVKRAALELLGPWQQRVERLAVWERGPCSESK